jgi:fermentation-respiration switch protein FrsA (DUF1100 family)
VLRYVVLACGIYAAIVAGMLVGENTLLFSGASTARAWNEPPTSLHVSEVTLSSDDGAAIHGWFTAPEGWQPSQGAVLISHGNGNNLSSMGECLARWRDRLGRAVLVYDYPGYGKSTGRPSEAGCYASGEAARQWLIENQHVPAGEIILVGESLGGAIAVELASRHSARLLVLHSAFTSFPDVAQARVPWVPARYLVRNQMKNYDKIGRLHCPVVITHGTADKTVPFAHGERLFAEANEPKKFVRMEGDGHHPPTNAEFFDTVRQFPAATSR